MAATVRAGRAGHIGTGIEFSGHRWEVKDSGGQRVGRGGNAFAAPGVRVAGDGLRLAVAADGRVWRCAEVRLAEPLGPGRYTVDVVGRLDRLDPNVVLGLFLYDGDSPDAAHHEVDIEFSRWGDPGGRAGWFTVHPGPSHPFDVRLTGTHTSHVIDVTGTSVMLHSHHGHGGTGPLIAARRWTRPQRGGAGAVRVHLNLWLYRGVAPTEPVEIVVSGFRFVPYWTCGTERSRAC